MEMRGSDRNTAIAASIFPQDHETQELHLGLSFTTLKQSHEFQPHEG